VNDPQQPGPSDPREVLRKFGVTLEQAQRHVMQPDHLREAREFVPATPETRFRTRALTSLFYTLDVDGLGRRLHDLLSPCLIGYALQLRRSGQVVLTQQWRWAKTWADGLTGWSIDTPMHVASVSKLITAMALTRLLDERGLSYDAPVAPWLPRYWPRGGNVDGITFRRLMTHRSGLFAGLDPNDPGSAEFPVMKDQIGVGAGNPPTQVYRNINFALGRILIATLSGEIDPGFLDLPGIPAFAPLIASRDPLWDILSSRAYAQVVNDRVFAPSGVAARAFEHPADGALAYAAPPDPNPGWNSQDLQPACAAVGWHLSVNELQRVLATFRRSGRIMSPARAEAMLEGGFGIDLGWPIESPMGPIYAKGGFWGDDKGRIEQTNAIMLPRRMELVILANSPLCKPGMNFMGQVGDAIVASIVPWYVSLFARLTPRIGAIGG
jgi:CubicO group peptidase (beta-lactamase class C family)